MDNITTIALPALIFIIALLYSSVGMAGGSGYVAAMALFSIAPAVMKPASLTLNIIVASIASIAYIRAGRFSWSILWPFLIASIPCAFIGGFATLQASIYKPIVGLVLLFASYQLVFTSQKSSSQPFQMPHRSISLIAGAIIGLLSGLTGMGGGVLLSPLLILARWVEPRYVSGISAVFILINSVSGLAGHFSTMAAHIPDQIVFWAIAAVAGGLTGSYYGSKRAGNKTIRYLLAIILIIAGLKMIAVDYSFWKVLG